MSDETIVPCTVRTWVMECLHTGPLDGSVEVFLIGEPVMVVAWRVGSRDEEGYRVCDVWPIADGVAWRGDTRTLYYGATSNEAYGNARKYLEGLRWQ